VTRAQIVNGVKSTHSGFEIKQRTTPTKTVTAN
jgi:hypothetical protein